MRNGDWMQTHTGKAFYPLDALVEDIDIEDIAHALSQICRYGGHTRLFYSVAEHCIHLSNAVSPENALWALLHDATEAYVGDMVRPLKRFMPDYCEAEDRLMATICYKWGLPYEMPAEVKDADNRILLDERSVLLSAPPHPWHQDGLEPLGAEIRIWTPIQAKINYLNRFAQLTAGERVA